MKYLGITIDLERDKLFDELGLKRMKESYMKDDETSPQQRFAFVSKQFGTDYEHAQRLYEYSSKHWLSYSTPILSFGRSRRGMPISCFLNYIDDTAEGLVENFSETSWLSMLGGGVGIGFGIRHAGDKSTGVLPHLKTYDASSLAYKQGTTRRGSYAAYLDISHPDIPIFLEMRKPTGDPNQRCLNLHHGINVSDDFMTLIQRCMTDKDADDTWEFKDPHTNAVVEKTSAKELWSKILEIRMQTGEPYLHFIDTSNRHLPQHLKDKGLKVRQSNLCVAPETQVLTDEGYVFIDELQGEVVNVWNGKEFTTTRVEKTSNSSKLITVTLDNGVSIDCTEYHKFYVQTGFEGDAVVVKRAYELQPGDKLIKYDLPVIDDESWTDFPMAYTHGFFCGDGTYGKGGKPRLYLYGEKKELIPYLELKSGSYKEDASGRLNFTLSDSIPPKFTVPKYRTLRSRLEWFAGLLDADGTVARNRTNESIQLVSINNAFLQNVKLMLQTMGIDSKIKQVAEAGEVQFRPTEKVYKTQNAYRLLISSGETQKLLELGLDCKRLKIEKREIQRDARQFIRVVSVEDNGRYDATYCFTESKRGMGMFNGVLLGNCSEITLPTDENRTAVCCLSSVNLEYFDEWSKDEQFLYDVAEMLDNVLSYFIEHAPDSIMRAAYSAMRERSIGIGALGFHGYLQRHSIPFESPMAVGRNLKMFKHIKYSLERANTQLAELRGPCPDAEEAGSLYVRFSHMTAIAPNATSSIIMGNTSPSVEPFRANAYRQDTLSGSFLNKNKHLDKLIKERCDADETLDYDDTWSSIIANDGSVQHLAFLSDWEKDVFKTAMEIDQRWIIQHASDRQQYIDQAQSINLFFRPDVNIKYLHAVHFAAWKQGLKSLYYCRSEKIGKADKVSQAVERKAIEQINLDELANGDVCLACEG